MIGLQRQGRHAAGVLVVLLALLFTVSSIGCTLLESPNQEATGPQPGDLTVLFIGSSYLDYNDLPAMIERFAIVEGRGLYVGRSILPGHRLDYFAADPATRRKINERAWDHVVLQGGSMNAAYPETHHQLDPNQRYSPVYPALAALKDAIAANNSETKAVYMMGWAYEDGLTWIPGQTDTYQDMQQRIYHNALAWSDSLNLTVAPVGWAWREVLGDSMPLHYLHDDDWNHANPRGTYLSAAVIYATLFGTSVEQLDYKAGLNPAEAERLRRIASRIVLDSLQFWNITP